MRKEVPSDWRDIPGYNGMYQVSWEGEVRSWRKPCAGDVRREEPILLTQYIRGGTYQNGNHCGKRYTVHLQKDGKRKEHTVMGLVIDVWMGGRPNGLVAYHKNGDIGDNSVHNIAFAPKRRVGKINGAKTSRKPVLKIDLAGEVLEVYPSLTVAAKAHYMDIKSVTNRCNGKVKYPGEFTFCWDE